MEQHSSEKVTPFLELPVVDPAIVPPDLLGVIGTIYDNFRTFRSLSTSDPEHYSATSSGPKKAFSWESHRLRGDDNELHEVAYIVDKPGFYLISYNFINDEGLASKTMVRFDKGRGGEYLGVSVETEITDPGLRPPGRILFDDTVSAGIRVDLRTGRETETFTRKHKIIRSGSLLLRRGVPDLIMDIDPHNVLSEDRYWRTIASAGLLGEDQRSVDQDDLNRAYERLELYIYDDSQNNSDESRGEISTPLARESEAREFQIRFWRLIEGEELTYSDIRKMKLFARRVTNISSTEDLETSAK